MGDEPRPGAFMLFKEKSLIYHEITNYRHAGQRPDMQAVSAASCLFNRLHARQPVSISGFSDGEYEIPPDQLVWSLPPFSGRDAQQLQ